MLDLKNVAGSYDFWICGGAGHWSPLKAKCTTMHEIVPGGGGAGHGAHHHALENNSFTLQMDKLQIPPQIHDTPPCSQPPRKPVRLLK